MCSLAAHGMRKISTVSQEVAPVRFGKKNRLRLASLRRNMQDKRMDDSRIVPFAESLGGITPQTAPAGDMDIAENDPTQKLLTILGRFQRIVARAEAGQDVWSDDCMAQLLCACEVCVGQRWGDMLESVTDTARILQSYEDADRQRESLPFLGASYELLCLMAGDLMVDSVRPSVMSKWREHYAMEVVHLAGVGVRLIQDDDTVDEPADDDDLETVIAVASRNDDDDMIPEPAPSFAQSHPSGYNGSFEWVRGGVPSETSPIADPLSDEPEIPEDDDEIDDLDEPRFRLGETRLVPEEPLDISLPELPVSQDTVFAPISAEEDPLDMLDETPQVEDPLDDMLETDNDQVMAPEPVAETEMAPVMFDEPVVEIEEAPIVEAVSDETVCAEPAPAATDDTPSPLTGNPEMLLATAREAFARGDIAGAKALALQVALAMAQCETSRTEEQVKTTEERLRNNACAVERARFDVRDAETLVEDTTKRVAEGEAELQEKASGADDIQLDCECIEETIAKLDEEIRALMVRRDEELAHLAETRGRLEAARMAQDETAAELEQRREAEQAARVRLENARQTVKALTFKSAEIETALARARDELDRRVASVQDIEKTLDQTGAETGTQTISDDSESESDMGSDDSSLF